MFISFSKQSCHGDNTEHLIRISSRILLFCLRQQLRYANFAVSCYNVYSTLNYCTAFSRTFSMHNAQVKEYIFEHVSDTRSYVIRPILIACVCVAMVWSTFVMAVAVRSLVLIFDCSVCARCKFFCLFCQCALLFDGCRPKEEVAVYR